MRIIIAIGQWNEEKNHSRPGLDIHMLRGTDVEALVIKSGQTVVARWVNERTKRR